MKTAKQASARMQDMTVGDPLKLLIACAMPMLIGNLFQQVYTMIDTMEMGYFVGDDAISAVGAVSALYNLLMSLVMSMNNGFAIPVTQAFGSHNEERLRRSIAGMLNPKRSARGDRHNALGRLPHADAPLHEHPRGHL